jgi:hypothetical protein
VKRTTNVTTRWSVRVAVAAACVATAGVITACGSSSASVKYLATDRNSPQGVTLAWNFETDPVGVTPGGVEVFSGDWEVRANEEGAPSPPNVLCQTASETFPALALDNTIYEDLDVSTRFKAISGKNDQAAGIIFRVQDKDNYYILRANALENSVNLYKYTAGSRSELKGASVPVSSGQWHELRVETNDETLRGYLDGALVVETPDDTFHAGRVGLWTKADSVTCFDDVKAKAP